MKYMCLIYGDEAKHPQAGTPEMGQLMENYMAFTKDIREKNVMVAGDPLEPVATATTVRMRGGKTETTDGPFAETKEQLGGYYILDCKDLRRGDRLCRPDPHRGLRVYRGPADHGVRLRPRPRPTSWGRQDGGSGNGG